MLLRPARRRGRGSASHLAQVSLALSSCGTGLLQRTSSTTRETHLSAMCRRRSRSPCLRTGHADRTPSDAFPAARCVASLAMVRRSKPVSTSSTRPIMAAKCAWKRHGVTLSRGGHLSATCRRRSRSPFFAPATRIARLPMRFRLRSASRRSRWSPQHACLARSNVIGTARSAKRSPQRTSCAHRLEAWVGGGRRLLARTIASDATYSVAGNRIARRGDGCELGGMCR